MVSKYGLLSDQLERTPVCSQTEKQGLERERAVRAQNNVGHGLIRDHLGLIGGQFGLENLVRVHFGLEGLIIGHFSLKDLIRGGFESTSVLSEAMSGALDSEQNYFTFFPNE